MEGCCEKMMSYETGKMNFCKKHLEATVVIWCYLNKIQLNRYCLN